MNQAAIGQFWTSILLFYGWDKTRLLDRHDLGFGQALPVLFHQDLDRAVSAFLISPNQANMNAAAVAGLVPGIRMRARQGRVW